MLIQINKSWSYLVQNKLKLVNELKFKTQRKAICLFGVRKIEKKLKINEINTNNEKKSQIKKEQIQKVKICKSYFHPTQHKFYFWIQIITGTHARSSVSLRVRVQIQ